MIPQSLNDRTARYRHAVAEEWRDLTVTVHGEERRLPLERVFFMLQARERPEPEPTEPPRSDLDPARARLQDAGAPPPPQPPPPPVPLEAALAKGEHMALLGEPGAGKSTALQFIGLCFARADENWHRERLGIQRPYIPILLNLQARAYAIAGQETLWDALRAEVRERLQCAENEAEALLCAWRQEPGLLVLLDGLDEVPGALRKAVRERIQRFAQSRAGWVILTSRPAGFQPLPGLREYLLKPFEDPEAEALPYLRGWLAALKPEWTAEEAGARARELLERMRAHPALRRLLDNPLLLRLSAQHYAQAGEIARSRADLYRLWVEEAWERARRRGAKEEEKPRFLEALQALAWHLHTGGGNEEADLLRALQRFGLAQDGAEAEGLLGRLREQTGLLARLSEAEDGKARHRYVFSHQTLREYFVALRLKEAWERDARRAWRFLRPRLHLPDWREPLALLVGSLPEPEALRLLEWILHARSPEEDFLRRDLFLAAELAGESGHAKAMWERLWPRLRRALKDKERWVRDAVVEALGVIGVPAVPALLETLKDRDGWVGQAAAETLGQIGPPATPALIQALRDQDGGVREAAAEALGAIGDPQATPALIQALRDQDGGVREAAAEALGQIGDPQATPALIQALRDPVVGVRKAAAWALGQIGDPQAVPALMEALQDEDVRRAAAWALGQIGDPQATPALIQALRDPVVGVRWAAAKALGQIGDPQATPALIQALRDEEGLVCQAAAEALGQIGPPAVPALIQALQDEKWEVRQAAAEALGQIGPPAVPALIQALQDEKWEVRRAAAEALGQIGDPQATPALIQALRDQDGGVRWMAAEALGQIGDPQAIPALIQALRDPVVGVRWMAAEALGQIGDPQAIPALIQALQDEKWEVRRAAAEALGQIGSPAVPALIQALQEKDWEMRRAAAEALGQIGDPQATPALIQALRDEMWMVREAAAEALLKLPSISLPQNEQERRAWQKRLTSIRRAARRAKDYELLAAVLERQAAWETALSPWQDPRQPPPVPAWRAWARRAGGGALVLLIAGLAALATAVLSGIGERLAEAALAFVQQLPRWAALLAIVLIIVIAALLDWIREALRKKT
jgi:HEAT repeat protein